jgi:hypothetical protein
VKVSFTATAPSLDYWTVNIARAVARAPAGDVQVTSTGYVPNAVFPPICHVHDTAPAPLAVFGPRPCAELGPLLYVTTTVQLEVAAVVAFALALALRDTGDVTVSETAFVGCWVAGAVGGNVDVCVGVTVRWVVAVAGAGDAMVDAAVAVGVVVTRTSWGVVPGGPGTLVTCALDVALRPRGVAVDRDDPDPAGAHATRRARAHVMRSLPIKFMAARGTRR